YTTAEYAHFVTEARKLIPGVHLGTDIIVGFPGETDEDFEQQMRFIEKMNFANIHIFTYSRREGTPAAGMPGQVAGEIVNERRLRLAEAAEKMKAAFVESQAGETLPVLFERKDRDGYFRGWSDNYINVVCADPAIKKHVITQIKTTGISGSNSLVGEIAPMP
ncbi:MAG: hypothetical protein WC082_05230, partial [Victivallales bacterium]